MSKGTIILIATVLLLAIFGMNGCSTYNGLVESREQVRKTWQNVEAAYQLRLDKIPNLVATVKGQADFERSTLEAVINARANATKVTINPEKLDDASMKQFQEAQGNVSSALARLMVVVEQYPDLKTNAGFTELRAEISETENMIKKSRTDYNEITGTFNTRVQKFPGNIWAGIFGFQTMPYFESDAGAEKAPKVDFETK
ncbi:MAG: LemA family protein [Bacteroidetes bacterium]|nr:LemA family protein [Bacteroidota bacterium]